jgi:predicted ATPase
MKRARLATRFLPDRRAQFFEPQPGPIRHRVRVWFVDLAPLSAPNLVAQTVTAILGIREDPRRSAREASIDAVRHRSLLLVFDNCEHLLTTCADLVEALIGAAPAARILTTTRETLRVAGEVVGRVPSLSRSEAEASVSAIGDAEATQLFIERASAVDATFAPTQESAGAIARICRHLEGIPLAIELAAARSAFLSPQQIEARLQDRFRFLRSDARSLSPATGRSRRPWTGATSFSRNSNASCFAGSRCSMAGGRSGRPSTCAPAKEST